jgi:hypothetical protein
MSDGYYWAAHTDGTTFVVLREGSDWYVAGIREPINFDPSQIIEPVQRPDHLADPDCWCQPKVVESFRN